MMDGPIEDRLVAAFAEARATTSESPDLFDRVNRSLVDARERRRYRLRLAVIVGAFVAAGTGLALSLSDINNRSITMDWWVIELLTNLVLVALAIGLGPFIKRFGRAYAADVFQANPRTGKSYLVLTDVAYYLIFTSFVLFTVTFVQPDGWASSTGRQLKSEVARVGGILLIMGVLHALNVVALPVIGGLLSSNRRNEQGRPTFGPNVAVDDRAAAAPFGAGTWILRVEPGPASSPPSPPADPVPS